MNAPACFLSSSKKDASLIVLRISCLTWSNHVKTLVLKSLIDLWRCVRVVEGERLESV